MTDYTEAWRYDREVETLWENESSTMIILAPHGGDIEFGTDDVAARIHKMMRTVGVKPTTWMYHGFHTGDGAFDKYHTSSNHIEFDQYDKLSQLEDRSFDYAVSIHMHNEDYVSVGGRIEEDIRKDMAVQLRSRLPDSKEVRWKKEEMKYDGSKKSNIVNKFTHNGENGLQLELTPKTAYIYRKRVARSVRHVYDELV